MLSSAFFVLQSVLMPLFKALIGLFGIGLVIAVHEFGHFSIAKLFKVKTPNFSIGFGPQLFSRVIGDTTFSLSAIPLGGYVELAGAYEPGQGDQKLAHDTSHGSFQAKPYWQKLFILLGGIAFNVIFAYFILSSLCFVGLPEHQALTPFMSTNVIEKVSEGSPAAQAGLQPSDTIVAINGKKVNGGLDILRHIYSNADALTFTIKTARDQQKTITIAEPALDNGQNLSRGITLTTDNLCYSGLFRSLRGGYILTKALVNATAYALISIFKTRDTKQLMGPVGLIGHLGGEGSRGTERLLFLLALISINLALINLLPLPILDGGQVLIYSAEAATGRRLPLRAREIIFIACWLLMITLFMLMSYRDIANLWGAWRQKKS